MEAETSMFLLLLTAIFTHVISSLVSPNSKWYNDELSDIFEHLGGPEEIKNAIMSACSGKTRDNFSFYIIPIQNVLDSAGIKQNILSFLYSFI